MLSDSIFAATLATTRALGKSVKNAVRGAIIFGSLAGGAILGAHILGSLFGLSLFGMAATPLLPIVIGAAVIGAGVQFIASFIPTSFGKASTQGKQDFNRNHDDSPAPAYSKGVAKSANDLPDINPDARTDNVARLHTATPPMRDAGYAASLEAAKAEPQPVNAR